jgi:hypothetical protein
MTYLLTLLLSVLLLQQTPQDCWGSDQRCSDGKYRDRQGREQPDSCDNAEHGSAAVHTCACLRTKEPETCGPRSSEGGDCKVYCRGGHCHCINSCDD